MKELMWTVLVTSVILQCFGEIDAYRVYLKPSPTVKVKEGDALTLCCSCNGSKNPDYINWYLNNETHGLVIETSSCKYQTRLKQYEIDRYSIVCHETEFNLTITNISKDKDDQDTWECDTTVIGMQPPLKASTRIDVIGADAVSVHLVPSPIAEVKEGNTLILHCSYNGSNNPNYINWYLNNDTVGLVIDASSCKYKTRPGQYEIDRYSISCHENKFDLSIASISKDKDHQDTWQCDTTVIGMHPPQKASTTIVVIDAGKNGHFDEPKTVVVTGIVVGVISAFTVTIAAGYFLHRKRKRRNAHVKKKTIKEHHKDQEPMFTNFNIRICDEIVCKQA